jgi:ABC-type spermidine/putrescine transport system permease subunit I
MVDLQGSASDQEVSPRDRRSGAAGPPRSPRRSRLGVLNVAPFILWMLVFLVAPLGVLLLYSLWSLSPDFSIDRHLTLTNYAALFHDPLIYKSFFLSLRVALFSTVGAVFMAYPFAYFLAKRVRRFQVIAVVAVAVPFLTSYILRAYAWRTLLGSDGVINRVLLDLHLVDQPISALLYSPIASGIGLLYIFLPVTILPIYAVLERIPDSLIEASENLGASPARTFWEIVLPLSIPGVLVGAVFTFVFAMGEYIVPSLLGGGKQLLYSETIVFNVNANVNWPTAAAMSLVLMALTLLMVAIVGRQARRVGLV